MSEQQKSRLPLLLGALVALGAAVLVDRWLNSSGTSSEVATAGRPAGTSTAGVPPFDPDANARKGLVHPMAALPLSSLEDTLSRPLFEVSRRAPAVQREAPIIKPAAPAAEVPTLNHKLIGVVLSPGHAVAVLAKENGRAVRAEQGDSVDGWVVRRIDHNQVLLSRNGRDQVLTLTRR